MAVYFIGLFFVMLVPPAVALLQWGVRRGFGMSLVVGLWTATALLFVSVAVMPAGFLGPNAFWIFLGVPFVAFVSTFALRDARRASAGLPPVAHTIPDKFGAGHRLLWAFLALLIAAVGALEWFIGEMHIIALGTAATSFALLWGSLTGRFPRTFERIFELRHASPPDSRAAP